MKAKLIEIEIKSSTPQITSKVIKQSNKKRPHRCLQCEAEFAFPNKLRLHIKRKHSNSYKCSRSDCSASFNLFNELRSHMKISHPISHKCSQCEYATNRPFFLRRHVEVCHVNGVRCPIETCSEIMPKCRLKAHLESEKHRKQSPSSSPLLPMYRFQCTRCVKEFANGTNLRRHMVRCSQKATAAVVD